MMTSANVEHLELIKSLADTFSNPILLIDAKGLLLYSNKKAFETFRPTDQGSTLYDLFDKEEGIHLEEIVENLNYEIFPVEKKGSFKLVSGIEVSLHFRISHYTIENSDYYFIQVERFEERSEVNSHFLQIEMSSDDVAEIIHDSASLNIIKEVQSNYPFTLLGKNKLQNAVNKLDSLFWLKDNENKFLLVNQRFADFLGLRIAQIEGKNENLFVPQFSSELYNSMGSYVKSTGNIISLRGVPAKGFTTHHKYESVIIPLLDADNNVVVTLGFSNKHEDRASAQSGGKISGEKGTSLEEIPYPVCIFNSNGEIENSNKLFNEMMNLLGYGNTNLTLEKVFGKPELQKINAAISTNQEEVNIIFSGINKEGKSYFQAKINKLHSDKIETNAYFLVVENLDAFDSFEALIKTRGKMFDTLIKSMPDPILIYDAENLRFLEANDAAIALYGYSHDEFLQMDLTDLYSPDDIQTLLDSSHVNKKNVFSGPFQHKKKDGSSITVEIFKDTFKYENKEAHFTIIKNISEKLEKESEFKLYKSVFDSTEALVVVTDNSGFIKFINQNLIVFAGMSKTTLLGNSLVSLFSDEDRGIINAKIFSSKIAETTTLKVQMKNAQKLFVPAELTALPNINNSGIAESFTILIKVKQETEKEVVVETIEKSRKQLEPAQLSTIFHEILTPINVMLGFMQEIRESIESPTPDQKESIAYIQENQQELMGTMNSIAEYATLLKEEDSQISTFAVPELFDKIKREFNESPAHKKHSVITKISPLWIEGDEQKYKMFFGTIANICAKVSDQNHFYFSVEQVDENEFFFSMRDALIRITDELLFALEPVLIQNGDVSLIRPYGVSRFAILSLRELMRTLHCNIEIVRKGNEPYEMGFFFPMRRDASADAQMAEESPVLPEAAPAPSRTATVITEPAASTTQIKEAPASARQTSVGRRTTVVEEQFEKVAPPPPNQKQEEPTVRLRRTLVEEFNEAPKEKKPLELQKLSCLYIEDQVDSQILFKVQMKDLGDIKFAVSFEEALPLITSQSFDFIVMDINLQGEYNGLDALKMIHQMPGFQSLPIIAVTAYVLPGDREKFVAAGFNEFISKPIFREKLIEALEKIFSA